MDYILVGALLLFLLVLYAVRQRDDWGIPVEEKPGLVRAITAVLAAAIAAGAALWLNHLASEPDPNALAYILTAGICAGAVIYLVGTVVGQGQLALRLRRLGWTVLVAPLFVPSTFSLLLPVVAALVVTLRRLPPRTGGKQPAADGLQPQ